MIICVNFSIALCILKQHCDAIQRWNQSPVVALYNLTEVLHNFHNLMKSEKQEAFHCFLACQRTTPPTTIITIPKIGDQLT